MSSLSRELVFLILQFLDEEKFKETVHKYATSYTVFNHFLNVIILCFCEYVVIC